MFRTYTLRLRPNKAQVAEFECILADSCETYNAALQERIEAWKLQRKRVTYNDQCSELTQLRKDPEFSRMSIEVQRDPIRRLDNSFKAFFRRCRAREKPGFPRFRSRLRYKSFSFGKVAISKGKILIPKAFWLRFKSSQEIDGEAKTATVKCIGKKWIVRLCCDLGPAPEKCAVSTAVGIDLGLTNFVTLSDGRSIDNPRWTRKHEARIVAANRALARKQRRSKNRLRAKEILRRAHQRVADARRNFTHHVSKWLVSNYDLIAFEKLNIKGMVQSSFGKSINDTSWAELVFQITYKAESAGKWAVPVNPRGTSIRCSVCGEDVRKTLWERRHICACGADLDRDHNAAINVLALGRSAMREEYCMNTLFIKA